ncbi:MAG: hypothetical protein AAGF97_12305 [Planctomycetota bacterium]
MEKGDSETAVRYHEQRLQALAEDVDELNRKIGFFSKARGIAFLLFVFLLICGWSGAAPGVWCFSLAAITCVVFITFVSLYDHRCAQRDVARIRQAYHRQQLGKRARAWDTLPADAGQPPSIPAAVVSHDLDLFGRASLFQLVNEAHTPGGLQELSQWLAVPAEPDEITRRQEAVRWLAAQPALREELALAGRVLAATGANPEVFSEWGKSATWLSERPWVLGVARGVAAAVIGITALVGFQLIPAIWMLLVFGLIVFSLLFNAFYLGTVHDIFNKVTVGRYELEHYRTLFQGVWDLPDDVPKFEQMKQRLRATGENFNVALGQLSRLVSLSSGRRAGALSLLYLIVQLLTLWDFHMLARLERWQRRFGPSLEGWFHSVAELEALCSLAGLAFQHPTWAFPRVADNEQGSTFVAQQLGHPLLVDERSVKNDVDVGVPGSFLLVTGSNMSGKSTLLRAIGLNTVLAQAGSVCCAAELDQVPIHLATSMRIDDSLEDGVSFFMAELQRLKEIVDEARICNRPDMPQLLFLLDEILQGTNSRERHLAVERILGHLVEMRATGAVSTHDLELANSESLSGVARTVHFRETFRGQDEAAETAESMQFDYQLREGVCPTSNALKLMELVGLS